MPPRAEPGHRDRIEAALSPAQLAGLRSVCETLGIAPGHWQEVPALASTFQTVAAVRLASQLRAADPAITSTRRALEAAGFRLGIAPDTVRTRLRRLGSL